MEVIEQQQIFRLRLLGRHGEGFFNASFFYRMSFNWGVCFTFVMQEVQSGIFSRSDRAFATKITGWSLRATDGGTEIIASMGGRQIVSKKLSIVSTNGPTAARSCRYFN